MRTGKLETSRAETPRAEVTGKDQVFGEGSCIRGMGQGAVFASASQLSQRESDFTVGKDRLSSWMEMPQEDCFQEDSGNAKVKIRNPKCADGLGRGWAAPGAEVAPGTRQQLPVMTLFIFTFRYYNQTLNDKG